uniref:Leucine carboxyl methyltransferase n=1 Tax=Chenopodium quinoa TaxID=63459 RepID=A0A803N2Z1_CHEQI
MATENDGFPEAPPFWSELKLPSLLSVDSVQKLHAAIEKLLARESQLTSFYEKIRKDCLNQAREVSGVILAVRTLWFDSKLEAAVSFFNNDVLQVVLLGAGQSLVWTQEHISARMLDCLTNSHVFEVDFPQILQVKASLLQEAMVPKEDQQEMEMKAKMLTRVEADITGHDWLKKLQNSGFEPEKKTVWILEGILYYLSNCDAIDVLKTIASYSTLTTTVLLADFMNKQ